MRGGGGVRQRGRRGVRGEKAGEGERHEEGQPFVTSSPVLKLLRVDLKQAQRVSTASKSTVRASTTKGTVMVKENNEISKMRQHEVVVQNARWSADRLYRSLLQSASARNCIQQIPDPKGRSELLRTPLSRLEAT